MARSKVTAKAFSRNVKTLRLARGWSLETLAGAAGISRQALDKIERGGGASIFTALRLAEVLQTEVRDLVA